MDHPQYQHLLTHPQAADIPQADAIRNAMSIDVEDYFHVSAFAPYIPRDSWPDLACRIEANMDWILGLTEALDIKATFFVLGWIAERYPHLVKRVHQAGHEVASHGYGHQRVNEMTPEAFLRDVSTTKFMLEQLTGQPVVGYRAPSFSIDHSNQWAWDVLQAAGYRYSSSVYPIRHDHYGMADAPRFPFYPRDYGGLLEIPITTVRMLDTNLPAGGGGYFRLLPYPVSRWMINHVNTEYSAPCIFYFHPWEIDPGQPRPCKVNMQTRWRHYLNLGRMRSRIELLAHDFRWDRIDRIFLDRTWMQ